jgi:selenocysteine lyase/cysteine desulfurase
MLKTPATLEEIRAREFARLGDHAYLDYTGSALYGESQLRKHQALLEQGLFGNPHSDSSASRASTEIIDAARRRVLRFFDVDESTHEVCFTANTSGAIKLVAEGYPFADGASLALSVDNHNSVNGIREYARRAGAAVRYLPLDRDLRLDDPLAHLGHGPGLMAFPAQSNFSGVHHPLSLVAAAQSRGFDVLLDAAAYAPSCALSLRECPADFTVLSFYKLFGYPTGLGALIARRESLARLRRPWFAGGTVLWASVAAGRHRLRARHEGFEDGTADFLGIAALEAGFALLDEVQMPRLRQHVSTLTGELLEILRSLPNVTIYGPADTTARGGTVAFNVHGVPYGEVERRARELGVSVRGGCFCNPGASESAFGIDAATIDACVDQLGDAFTPEALAACSGRTVGAVRASVGLANTRDDVRRLAGVVMAVADR